MTIDWGLKKTGYIAPTYEEFLDSVEDDFRTRFGDKTALTSNSNLGVIARLMADAVYDQTQQQEMIYYSRFYSTAFDSSLDRLAANVDLWRKVDTPARAQIVITTSDEYLIQKGEKFETEDGFIFDLVDDVLTTKQNDGTFQGTGNVQCEEKGEIGNVDANTITIVSNPDEDIISVTNPQPAGGGQDYEDDETFRKRLIMGNAARPSPTEPGIKSALMNLSGVKQVGFIDNSKYVTDEYGNPPCSVHVYVLGGNDQDIAQCLIDYGAAGINLAGSLTYSAKDAAGDIKEVKFDHAKQHRIYVKVQVNINNAWNSDNGVDDIKEAICDEINSLELGQKLYLTRLYPVTYDVNGVNDAVITIGSDRAKLGSADIAVDRSEFAHCDLDDVEVDLIGL